MSFKFVAASTLVAALSVALPERPSVTQPVASPEQSAPAQAQAQKPALLARKLLVHDPQRIEVQGETFWAPGKAVSPDGSGGYRLSTSQSYVVLVPLQVRIPRGAPAKTLTVKLRTGIHAQEGELGSFTFVATDQSRTELVALSIYPSSAGALGAGALWTEVYDGAERIDWWQTFVEIVPPK